MRLPLALLCLVLSACPGPNPGDDDAGDDDSQASIECGDGIAGVPEDCDGADSGACPGRCSEWCTCPSAAPGDLAVTMIDVWQGDAILVVSPDGFVLLVDAGPWDHLADIEAAIASAGLAGIDYTLLTHNHSDHYGNLAGVLLEHPEIDVCFDHGHDDTDGYWAGYADAAGERRTTVAKGDTIDLGPSVDADVIHAWAGSDSENDNSIVLRLRHGDTTFLLGGDCEWPDCEGAIHPGQVDVYKVHHHGSADSSSDQLLSEMDPTVALISVGSGNAFGHPHDEAMDRLAAHGAFVYRTDQDGDVTVVSDGSVIDVTTED